MSLSAALLVPTSTLVQCHGALRPLGANGECKSSLQWTGAGWRHRGGMCNLLRLLDFEIFLLQYVEL